MRRSIVPVLATFLLAAGPARSEIPSRGGAQDRVAPGIVDGATAHELVAEGVKVVDVRTPEEYAAGHVPGAVNVPYDQMARRSAELGPPTTPLLLYCHSGRRSGIAAQVLKEKGFTHLYDLQAYDRWLKSEPKAK